MKYVFNQKEIYTRYRRWMKFLKDYIYHLQYHLGKANVVVYALSRKKIQISSFMIKELGLVEHFKDMKLNVKLGDNFISYSQLIITYDFLGMIKDKKLTNSNMRRTKELVGMDQTKDFEMRMDGVMKFSACLCVEGWDGLDNSRGRP